MTPSVLTIAGSDSGGGAGIQADLKTFAAHGVHGLSAIAALTAQNTRGVTAVHVPPVEFLRAQLAACFDDFDVGAVKIGMLANREVIDTVVDVLSRRKHARSDLAIVLDPVMIATSGARLLEDSAIDALRTRLLPLADVVTPNVPEAEALGSGQIRTRDDLERAANTLLTLGARSVFLKGGHVPGDPVRDLFLDTNGATTIEHPRIDVEGHGTGCTLSSAIAANLALGLSPREACLAASDYVHRALLAGSQPGSGGLTVLGHWNAGNR
ncbi:bifunctional hydroxymethylpyrimidine kinase/phosphomethylpyrimidine kinase [Solilutibacter silvestris]|uniref:hydroxymethylpyrimidine kinase n=1 Tax=Solilutibacter silvestris TaxID=1645665 RepID=A0A2K1PZ66_9GAMM|nr:bifunctional hydroxymethylpyrimidine kinase/phosphomethylpyrimidine kinase [Lysobacter silvestris]PNS07967.1 phosphomethylpyrimidine kinase [Lysobacter silvestris]